MTKYSTYALIIALLSLVTAAHAVLNPENQDRWVKPTDNDLPDKSCPGFLVNLGPTGARARLTANTFIIAYIFPNSPAAGRLVIGDIVTGVYGTPFATHTFGGNPIHGYEGPIMQLGEAIENAEGGDGMLRMTVRRGSSTIDVTVPIEVLGTFNSTFPLACPKSALIHDRAVSYLLNHPDCQSSTHLTHRRLAVGLALISGNTAAERAAGKQMVMNWKNSPDNSGTWTWNLSHKIILLSEYYILTHDTSVVAAIQATVDLLEAAQISTPVVVWPGNAAIVAAQQLYDGGFGHAPYIPGVDPNGGYGPNGYGPMQLTTMLAVTAWQLGKKSGATLHAKHVERALAFIHRGVNSVGYVAYGGEFTLNNGIVDPVAWKLGAGDVNYVGRTGCAIVSHQLAPSFPDTASHLAQFKSYFSVGNAYKSLPDGHADSNLGIFWGLMGASQLSDQSAFRRTMGYHKALFNMMRCFDGSFVIQPARDYADNAYYQSSRYHPTATFALAYGLGSAHLAVQGVGITGSLGNSTGNEHNGNAAPTMTAIADQRLLVSTVSAALGVTVGDDTTAVGSLGLSVSSSNLALVPTSGLALGGSGANRTLVISPVSNQTGSAIVTLTVNDAQGLKAATTFVVHVVPVLPPTISTVADRSTRPGTATSAIEVLVDDNFTPTAELVLAAASSDTTLLPLAGIVLGGTGGNRTVTLTPAGSLTGTVTVTLTVTDSQNQTATTSFQLTVATPPADDSSKCGFGSGIVGLIMLLALSVLRLRRLRA